MNINRKEYKFNSAQEALDWLRSNDGYLLDEYGNKYFIDDDNEKLGKELWGMNDEGVWEIYDIVYYTDEEFLEYHADDFSDLDGWLHIK